MFKQITIIDYTGLQDWALKRLQEYSQNPLKIFNDVPTSDEEAGSRIEDADCVFVSWNTRLTANILSKAKNLKYVGMCCSLIDKKSANVDIDYTDKNEIVVKGIRDYGDDGVAEYIISELIRLFKGIGSQQWKNEPVELTGRKVGIIGMGTTGKMLADRLQAFGAKVSYYSRNRKPEVEEAGVNYMPLDELLATSEILSFHLPRNTNILGEREFELLGNGKIIVNTSLGFTFDKSAFDKWIANPSNFAIFDGEGVGQYKAEYRNIKNIISTDHVSGWTKEAKGRLSEKVLDNVIEFIKD
jgi:lactate dehydrogenase-like 2-hydroxyacid dehydrogenase